MDMFMWMVLVLLHVTQFFECSDCHGERGLFKVDGIHCPQREHNCTNGDCSMQSFEYPDPRKNHFREFWGISDAQHARTEGHESNDDPDFVSAGTSDVDSSWCTLYHTTASYVVIPILRTLSLKCPREFIPVIAVYYPKHGVKRKQENSYDLVPWNSSSAANFALASAGASVTIDKNLPTSEAIELLKLSCRYNSGAEMLYRFSRIPKCEHGDCMSDITSATVDTIAVHPNRWGYLDVLSTEPNATAHVEMLSNGTQAVFCQQNTHTYRYSVNGSCQPTKTRTNAARALGYLRIMLRTHPHNVRLVDGKQSGSGIVEMNSNEGWKAVCDKDWGHHEARVVCRELGYSGGMGNSHARKSNATEYYRQFWKYDITCRGEENRLADCSRTDDECGEDGLAAGVICQPAEETEKSLLLTIATNADPGKNDSAVVVPIVVSIVVVLMVAGAIALVIVILLRRRRQGEKKSIEHVNSNHAAPYDVIHTHKQDCTATDNGYMHSDTADSSNGGVQCYENYIPHQTTAPNGDVYTEPTRKLDHSRTDRDDDNEDGEVVMTDNAMYITASRDNIGPNNG